jgi:hypothetical protein
MNEQWEYIIWHAANINVQERQSKLDKYGSYGWELVSVVYFTGTTYEREYDIFEYTFKKRVQ